MEEEISKIEAFEGYRAHLRGVAYRLLGSATEADDAVQEAWIRFDRTDTTDVENLGGWLTTVVGRVCLNMLRRRGRREEPLSEVDDPVIWLANGVGPEDEALLADSVGLALHVVLDNLAPAERLAFVLHDLFAVPFDEIAQIVGRSPDATRQLASRGRRRVQGAPVPDGDLREQRRVVDAFFAAARSGDLAGLIAVLDPDVVLHRDRGPLVRGAEAVASQAIMFADPTRALQPALVDGIAGVIVRADGRPVSIMGFTVVAGRIVAIETVVDRERVARLVP